MLHFFRVSSSKRTKINDAVRGLLRQQLSHTNKVQGDSIPNREHTVEGPVNTRPHGVQGNKNKQLKFQTPLVLSQKQLPLNMIAPYDATTGRYLHPITSTPAERVKMKKLVIKS